MDHAARHHHERTRRGHDLSGAHPDGELPLQDVEGLFVAAVKVGAGSGGARRDGIVVHRVGAVSVLVADLEYHRPTDGVREVLAVSRSYEDALVAHGCAFRSLACVTGIIWQERWTRFPTHAS